MTQAASVLTSKKNKATFFSFFIFYPYEGCISRTLCKLFARVFNFGKMLWGIIKAHRRERVEQAGQGNLFFSGNMIKILFWSPAKRGGILQRS